MKVRMLTVGALNVGGKDVPALRLSGQWLAKTGFGSGKKVIVQEKPGQIIIQAISIEEGEACG